MTDSMQSEDLAMVDDGDGAKSRLPVIAAALVVVVLVVGGGDRRRVDRGRRRGFVGVDRASWDGLTSVCATVMFPIQMRNISVALKEVVLSKQDAIVRQVTVSASIDRVWGAITQAEQLAQWFGDSAEIDLRVGGSITLGWSEHGDTTSGVVERVEEPYVFAFRWQASASVDGDPHSTLVTFTLTEVNAGTDVRVEETGLAALPGDVYDRTLEENSSGWTAELADLDAYLGAPQ